MAEPSFEELLNTEVATVERPPPMPEGTWSFMVLSYENIKSSQKNTPGVQFTLKPIGAGDDVEADALEEYLEKVVLADVKKAGNDTTFWMTGAALPMLREFIEKLGIDITGKTFKQALADAPGCEVKGLVRHAASQREGDDSVYANIQGYLEA